MSRILPTRSYLAAYRAVVGEPDAVLHTALILHDALVVAEGAKTGQIEIVLRSGGQLVLTLDHDAITASVRGGRFFDDAGAVRPAPVNRAELAQRIERATAASAPGARNEAAFEAARCLDAIEAHVAEPREGSDDFIARALARAADLMGVALEVV